MTATLFKACDAIVTCDDNGTVHRNADLLVVDNAVQTIAPDIAESELPADTTIVDATGHFIYPGLINTHHHFFQCFVRNHVHLDWTKLSVIEWLD